MPMLERLRRDLREALNRRAARRQGERCGNLTSLLAGTGQSTYPVASGAIDAVVCAQSFHWFATPAAVAEIHRVLKPGGVLGLIWNQRDESVSWVAELERDARPLPGRRATHDVGRMAQAFPALASARYTKSASLTPTSARPTA